MVDYEEIKKLMKSFDRSNLSKLKIVEGEFEIIMQKGGSAINYQNTNIAYDNEPEITYQSAQTAPSATITESKVVAGEFIRSPMVGTFYSSPSPDSASFVKVGDTVRKGQTLCILEAMKIMNEFEAEFDCKILEILINDASPVEYDMPIFRVERL